eukprot:1147927-Pelagomonas_calceolata.AAC.4
MLCYVAAHRLIACIPERLPAHKQGHPRARVPAHCVQRINRATSTLAARHFNRCTRCVALSQFTGGYK